MQGKCSINCHNNLQNTAIISELGVLTFVLGSHRANTKRDVQWTKTGKACQKVSAYQNQLHYSKSFLYGSCKIIWTDYCGEGESDNSSWVTLIFFDSSLLYRKRWKIRTKPWPLLPWMQLTISEINRGHRILITLLPSFHNW